MDTVCDSCLVKFVESTALKIPQVVDFLVSHGVLNAVTKCPRCRCDTYLDRETLLFRCQNNVAIGKRAKKRCTFKVTAKTGSFVERCRKPLTIYFQLISILLHLNPPRQELIMRELDVTNHFVVDWYSFCREVFIHHMQKLSAKLGGVGVIVEVDEAKFGKRKYNRGRFVEGQWVFGGVERGTKKSFLVPVERRDSRTLMTIIEEWILPGTTIISDCWKAYNCLADEGYVHLTVNHSYNFVDPDTGAHTNTVERMWREVRHSAPRFGVKKDHFVGYLAEFMFKRKYPHKERLHHFFKAAADLYKPKH